MSTAFDAVILFDDPSTGFDGSGVIILAGADGGDLSPRRAATRPGDRPEQRNARAAPQAPRLRPRRIPPPPSRNAAGRPTPPTLKRYYPRATRPAVRLATFRRRRGANPHPAAATVAWWTRWKRNLALTLAAEDAILAAEWLIDGDDALADALLSLGNFGYSEKGVDFDSPGH